MKRKAKSGTKDWYRAECAKLCRQIVFDRDGHKCTKCGKTKGQYYDRSGRPVVLQWSHLIRRAQSARLHCDPENSVVHCEECHRWWDNKNHIETMAWFVETLGQERWDYLYEQKRIKEPLRLSFWQNLHDHLKERLQ